MKSRLPLRLLGACGACAALPAAAHLTGAAAPHWHAGDVWGVLVVLALTGVAAWLDRRRR